MSDDVDDARFQRNLAASREEFRREMEKDFIWPTRILFGIVIACVGTILIGLSVTVPWLGIPL